MKMVSQSENLDGFKLIIAVILLFISILLFLRPMQDEAVTRALPEEGEEEQHAFAPDELFRPAPADRADDGQEDAAQAGNLVGEGEESIAQSQPEESESRVPPMPDSPISLYYSVQDQALLSMDGEVIYRLDSAADRWAPVVPDDLLEQVPGRVDIRQQNGEWVITETQQITRFRWDETQMAWVPETAVEGGSADKTEQKPESSGAAENEEMSLSIARGICPMPLASRLSSGMTVSTLRWLNQRSDSLMAENILLTNAPGTQLEIIDGPECSPYLNRAYLWWQVRNADGVTGWCAEGSLYGKEYFLEPLQ